MAADRRRVVALLLLAWAATARADDRPPAPLDPGRERATFRLADPGLAIELVAAEPEVVSPVAVAWDEGGRMFVAEMTDYPVGPAPGRIRLLKDRDGDGRYEHATVFADGIAFPTGVLPWRGGVLVTAAPDILFLRDADGDGRADERRVVLTGFGEGNTQLRVNGLSWGLDNWVYGANGRSDGEIRRPGDDPAQAVSIRRRDFRFRPETGEVEAVSGFSQFGLPRDDWGNRFPSWNTVPIRHAAIEERDLARNPHLAEASAVASILDPADPGRVFAISPPQATFNKEPTAYFNASCGPTIYRGDALGPEYRGDAFVCESLTNLVHRRVLEPRGTTFLARRAEPGVEFLASTDPAFRPVNLATGPDGALYVVDFYRELVEHPQFVPEGLRDSVDFRRWVDRGRIWRVAALGDRGAPAPKLGRADSVELVRHLGHPNGWWRDTAQRLLVERADRSAAPALGELARASADPLARLHALATLDGLGALDEATLRAALRDGHPGVREHAARLARPRPGLLDAILALADDPEVRVRFAAALALGDRDDGRVPAALARIAARDADDPWSRLAVLGGLGEVAWPTLRALLDDRPGWLADPTPGQAALLEQAAAVVGARRRPDELRALAARLAPDPSGSAEGGRLALLAGLAEGLARSGPGPAEALAAIGAADAISALLGRAREVAGSAEAPDGARARAVAVLARCDPGSADMLPGLLRPGQPAAVRSAAARAIGSAVSPELADRVLDGWDVLATDTRREALAALAGSAPLAGRLVAAIEADAVGLAELSASDREALRLVPDPDVRERFEALLAASAPPDRAEALRRAEAALALPGDPRRGADLFARDCRTCHVHRGEGNRVGPDLSGVAGRPAPALLKDIVDPNGEVAPDYASFVAVTRGGRVVSGLLAEETASSLKLRGPDGFEQTVLRAEVEAFRPTGRSLMPEGLEQNLGPQGLADLIAFLRQP